MLRFRRMRSLQKFAAIRASAAKPFQSGAQSLPSRHLQGQACRRSRRVVRSPRVVVYGHAGTSILEYAEEHGCDCIVIASHRPGLGDYLLGSTAARVVRHAACSVHVMR